MKKVIAKSMYIFKKKTSSQPPKHLYLTVSLG